MASQNSFDIVSQVDLQEVKNAIGQCMKEIRQRFDFKGSKSEITLDEKLGEIVLLSDDAYKLNSVIDILKTRLIKRQVSLQSLKFEKVDEAMGGTVRQKVQLQQGIPPEQAKAIGKSLRDAKLKVQAQIQGDQVRVLSKSRDELQSAITHLQAQNFQIALQFINYR